MVTFCFFYIPWATCISKWFLLFTSLATSWCLQILLEWRPFTVLLWWSSVYKIMSERVNYFPQNFSLLSVILDTKVYSIWFVSSRVLSAIKNTKNKCLKVFIKSEFCLNFAITFKMVWDKSTWQNCLSQGVGTGKNGHQHSNYLFVPQSTESALKVWGEISSLSPPSQAVPRRPKKPSPIWDRVEVIHSHVSFVLLCRFCGGLVE